MMIEEVIIKPIEDYMAGNGELHRFPVAQCARDCCRTGLQTELHNLMEPYYIMYIDDSARLDWTTRGIIAEVAHIDPHFGSWASRQDLMKMARAWALNEKLNVLARQQEEITLQMASELKKAFVEDAIPYAEIEEELLELPPKTVGNVFTILNDMLGGNEVWQRHFKELRKKVRKREKEKEVPQIDARHITMTGNDVTYNENNDKDE